MSYDHKYRQMKLEAESTYPNWLCALGVILALCVPSGIVFWLSIL